MVSLIIAIIISLTTGGSLDNQTQTDNPSNTDTTSNETVTTFGGSGNWTELSK